MYNGMQQVTFERRLNVGQVVTARWRHEIGPLRATAHVRDKTQRHITVVLDEERTFEDITLYQRSDVLILPRMGTAGWCSWYGAFPYPDEEAPLLNFPRRVDYASNMLRTEDAEAYLMGIKDALERCTPPCIRHPRLIAAFQILALLEKFGDQPICTFRFGLVCSRQKGSIAQCLLCALEYSKPIKGNGELSRAQLDDQKLLHEEIWDLLFFNSPQRSIRSCSFCEGPMFTPIGAVERWFYCSSMCFALDLQKMDVGQQCSNEIACPFWSEGSQTAQRDMQHFCMKLQEHIHQVEQR